MEHQMAETESQFVQNITDENPTVYLSKQGYDSEKISNNGSSHGEIFGLMLVEPGITLAMSMIYCLCISFGYRSFAEMFLSPKTESMISFATHAVTVNVIFILVATVWSEYLFTVLMVISLMLLCFSCIGWVFSSSSPKTSVSYSWKTVLNMQIKSQNRLPFLDDFRGHLLQMTAVSILAVDFEIFPVRYAKTDMYGWSVMDAGVGLFVGAHSICSSESRGKTAESLRKSILSSIPLFALGFIRLIAVSAVHYHQVISEYGVHWNFFFTLAFTKVACSLLSHMCSPKINSISLALIVAMVHQWLLSGCGMTEYILTEERSTFLDKNKEGICSLLGFVTIYFGSIKIGKLLWKPKYKIKDHLQLLTKLLCFWLIMWLLSYVLHIYVQPTSRRIANMPYCVWVMSFMCLHIAVHLAQHIFLIFFGHLTHTCDSRMAVMNSCLLWKATNYNGLFYFLMANVLTGIVNLSMETSEASATASLLVLYLYMALLTAFSTVTFNKSIQIKFW